MFGRKGKDKGGRERPNRGLSQFGLMDVPGKCQRREYYSNPGR